MAELDRVGMIDLLNRLGAGDDAAVLEAARALHRKASESGLSWDELLIRPDQDEDEEPAFDAGTSTMEAVTVNNPETARLIDRLLRKGLSESLRDDLLEMKRQIADGSLEPEDARYVTALARRLGA